VKKHLLFLIALGIVVLLAYEALITYDENFPYGRMWETPALRPHEELPLSMPKGTVPQQGGEEVFKATPAEHLKSPVALSDRSGIPPRSGMRSKDFCASDLHRFDAKKPTRGNRRNLLPVAGLASRE
jgi:hypothetical protein